MLVMFVLGFLGSRQTILAGLVKRAIWQIDVHIRKAGRYIFTAAHRQVGSDVEIICRGDRIEALRPAGTEA